MGLASPRAIDARRRRPVWPACRQGNALRRPAQPKRRVTMSVAKVIEINASSSEGLESAVQHGLSKAAESVKKIKGAWVNEIKVVTTDDGQVTEWRVNRKGNFIVD
jgi:flavin-binding protein dodecin